MKATEIAKKPRRNISSVIAGKAITEIDVSEKIEEYQLETAKKKNKPNGSKTKNCKSKSNKKQSNNEQQPGPSKENTKLQVVNFDNCDTVYPMKTSAFATRRSVVFVVTLNQRLCEINLTLNL